VSVAGGAAAIRVSEDDVPGPGDTERTTVGNDITATVTVSELFRGTDETTWTLRATTELESAEWEITYLDQAGNEVDSDTGSGAEISGSRTLTSDGSAAEVRVTVSGTVPRVDEYAYLDDDRIVRQQYVLIELVQEGDISDTIGRVESPYGTEESREARTALDAAREAIADPTGDSSSARTFQSAVSAYESGNFENAIDLAEQAQSQGEGSQQTRTVLYGLGGAVVLVLVLGGGVYWYRSRQSSYDKLG
jgi:hypothetical protein